MIARQPTVNKGDSWITVEDRLPEIFGKYWATIRYGDGRISEPVVVDFLGVPQKYVVDTPNGMEYETWGIDSAFHGSRVIAWRPYYIPEPYQPKPQNKPEERYPEWRAKLLSKFDRKKFKADCHYSKGYIERCIDESPTAYDVDVVCKELDKASDYYETEEQGKEHVQMVNLTAAIEIVRNGGKYD